MSALLRALTGALVALSLLAAPARAQIDFTPDRWWGLPGLNAPSGAQWVRALAYQGVPPTTVYAGLEGGGVFRSLNGGATWSAFNDGFANPLTTNTRALLTQEPNTVWAGNDSGVWRSQGGGAWQPIAQGTDGDISKKLNQSVQSLVSLPGDVMLAGVFSGGVYKSSDGGQTWSPPPANSGIPGSDTITGLTQTVPGVVYATGGSGVYVSLDAGSTWTRVSDGLPSGTSPITTWQYPQRPDMLFASTGSNGVYRSLNAGATWSPINDGLGAVRARGFQIFPGDEGVVLYAATEDGLWAGKSEGAPVDPPSPEWVEVTKDGLFENGTYNYIMWSLTTPVLPSQGSPGLIAGTQSNGGYFIAFRAPSSTCSESNPMNTDDDCPAIDDLTPYDGQTLSVQTVGKWAGTELIDKAVQWQSCSTSNVSSCADIPNETGTTYTVPKNAVADGLRYRVEVTATNPAPTFGGVVRHSQRTAVAADNPADYPGNAQRLPPSISVNPPGETTSPKVGDTMHAEAGFSNPEPGVRDEFFNPPSALPFTWQWLRCEDDTADDADSEKQCEKIPGATARDYVLQPADGDGTMRVRVKGRTGSLGLELESGDSYYVISTPATIAPDVIDADGAARSQAPALVGRPYVGETLAGDVGGWTDPSTEFRKTWVRCDAGGAPPCTTIMKEATTDPETGPTYVVRPGDVGYTIRLRVLADVNGDFTDNPVDDHLPRATEVDTPPTATITVRPVPGPPGGENPPGGGGDTTRPVISGLQLTRKAFRAGTKKKQGTTFRLTLSEAANLRIVVARQAKGRKVKGKCKPLTRKNRKAKKCSRSKRLQTITKADRPAGNLSIRFTGKRGRKRLPPGSYRATFTATDAAGNVSEPKALVFRIKRRGR